MAGPGPTHHAVVSSKALNNEQDSWTYIDHQASYRKELKLVIDNIIKIIFFAKECILASTATLS